jgi:hypothetical protein
VAERGCVGAGTPLPLPTAPSECDPLDDDADAVEADALDGCIDERWNGNGGNSHVYSHALRCADGSTRLSNQSSFQISGVIGMDAVDKARRGSGPLWASIKCEKSASEDAIRERILWRRNRNNRTPTSFHSHINRPPPTGPTLNMSSEKISDPTLCANDCGFFGYA